MARRQQRATVHATGWTLPAIPQVHPPVLVQPMLMLSWEATPHTAYQIFQNGYLFSPLIVGDKFQMPVTELLPSSILTIRPIGIFSRLFNSSAQFDAISAPAVSETRIVVTGANTSRTFLFPYVTSVGFVSSVGHIGKHSFVLEASGIASFAVTGLVPDTEYTVTIQITDQSVVKLTKTHKFRTLPFVTYLRERQLKKTYHHSLNAHRADFRMIRTIDPVPEVK